MNVVAFDRTGTPARILVEDRDRGVCTKCGMDTEYVKRHLNPLLVEAVNRRDTPWLAHALRSRVAEVLIDLGFSGAVAGTAASHPWAVQLNTHLWEADHILPVIHGGGGACGLDNLRTLCRACHHRATKTLAGSRAKTVRLVKKRERHEARMRAKQTCLPLVERSKWRR